MVLKKVLDKFRSPREPKKGSEEPEKSRFYNREENGGRAGSDSRKKLKKVRSVRVADLDSVRKTTKKTSHPQLDMPLQQKKLAASKGADARPNYMKSTSSYDARKEKHQVKIESPAPATNQGIKESKKQVTVKPTSSAAKALVRSSSKKLVRSLMKKISGVVLQPTGNLDRSNCSSNSEDSNTTDDLGFHKEDNVLTNKTCPYSYCSQHGHKHGTAPSVKRLLSARRQSLKAQKSIRPKRHTSIRRKGDKEVQLVEDVVDELFIEIQQAQTLQHERFGRVSRDDIELGNIISLMNKTTLEDQDNMDLLQESCSVTSFEDCGDRNSELSTEEMLVINQFIENIERGWKEQKLCGRENRVQQEEGSLAMPENSGFEANHAQDVSFDVSRSHELVQEESAMMMAQTSRIKLNTRSKSRKCRRMRRTSAENLDGELQFNPRPPRLLPAQADPELEKINLKHQEVDERKAAEDWMIDYALRKALRKLATARKSKVPLLVAAFETVMPHMCETLVHSDASGFISSMPAQACG